METEYYHPDPREAALVQSHRAEYVALLADLVAREGNSPGEPYNADEIVERARWIMGKADEYEVELWGRLGVTDEEDIEGEKE